MKTVVVNDIKFELIRDEKEAFDEDYFKEMFTDFFYDYDYIVGDISYSKLRLKGFYESDNKNVKKYNDVKNLEDYITNYCAFACKYFVLKKIK